MQATNSDDDVDIVLMINSIVRMMRMRNMTNSDGDVDMVLMINGIVRTMRMRNTTMVNAQGACVCFQTLASI